MPPNMGLFVILIINFHASFVNQVSALGIPILSLYSVYIADVYICFFADNMKALRAINMLYASENVLASIGLFSIDLCKDYNY